MKDNELAEKLINHPYFGNCEMRVKINQPSVAYNVSVGITNIYTGIDWDAGTMFFIPETPLVSWEYIEKYVPDIHEQIREEKHKRMSKDYKEVKDV